MTKWECIVLLSGESGIRLWPADKVEKQKLKKFLAMETEALIKEWKDGGGVAESLREEAQEQLQIQISSSGEKASTLHKERWGEITELSRKLLTQLSPEEKKEVEAQLDWLKKLVKLPMGTSLLDTEVHHEIVGLSTLYPRILARLISYLGDEGWEPVSVSGSPDNWPKVEIWFKRRV